MTFDDRQVCARSQELAQPDHEEVKPRLDLAFVIRGSSELMEDLAHHLLLDHGHGELNDGAGILKADDLLLISI
ncbi:MULTISPECIES: hypothetical protein [unclassified Polaromonas]|uniref:hypothetical protein n=1 Tax=unclassified Polaromonas TaxID=2638319 RepID=UPI00129ED170|nr:MULTISPECIES: hypothetical protein [unclassified Polaromonas]QGJ18571.1 hypothetical protein F7R28_09320 [Polaromonas sp. Pch-P]